MNRDVRKSARIDREGEARRTDTTQMIVEDVNKTTLRGRKTDND
jgi:hypothetical protein